MSFMRGIYYVWQDGKTIYLPPEMELTVFSELAVMRFAQLTKKEIKKIKKESIRSSLGIVVGRIYLPTSMSLFKFDRLVVKYLTQLTKKEIKEIEIRAIRNYSGNIGCDDLRKKYKLPTTLQLIKKIIKDKKERKLKNERKHKKNTQNRRVRKTSRKY